MTAIDPNEHWRKSLATVQAALAQSESRRKELAEALSLCVGALSYVAAQGSDAAKQVMQVAKDALSKEPK